MALIWLALARRASRARSLAFALACAILVGGLLIAVRSLKVGVAAGVLSAVLVLGNSLPRDTWTGLLRGRISGFVLSLLFWIGVGLEVFFPRPFVIWLRGRRAGISFFESLRFLPGAALSAAMLAVLLPFPQLMSLGQHLFMTDKAEFVFGPRYDVFSEFDVSDIALNPVNGDAYLCGDMQSDPKVLRLDGPVTSLGISNGGNEFCEFAHDRFISFDAGQRTLQIIDPTGPRVALESPQPDIPPGEVLLAAHPVRRFVVAASENEGGTGTAPDIRVIDIDSGKVMTSIDDDAGYVIVHSERPVLYINHFAMDLGVRSYDALTGQKLAASELFGRSDRMAFDPKRYEVLATSPESGQIFRFDATTLEARAPYETVFGARGLAVDTERDLLLVSSFLTNMLDVIDMKTGKSLRRYRLGPWMRDVRVLSDGVALVASRYGVYRVHYLD